MGLAARALSETGSDAPVRTTEANGESSGGSRQPGDESASAYSGTAVR
jgi:hypothetical protein